MKKKFFFFLNMAGTNEIASRVFSNESIVVRAHIHKIIYADNDGQTQSRDYICISVCRVGFIMKGLLELVCW